MNININNWVLAVKLKFELYWHIFEHLEASNMYIILAGCLCIIQNIPGTCGIKALLYNIKVSQK